MLALSIHRVLFNDLNGDLPFSSAGDLFEDIEFIVLQGSILRIRYVDLFEVHKAGVIVEEISPRPTAAIQTGPQALAYTGSATC